MHLIDVLFTKAYINTYRFNQQVMKSNLKSKDLSLQPLGHDVKVQL